MLTYKRLAAKPAAFKVMTGLSVEEFRARRECVEPSYRPRRLPSPVAAGPAGQPAPRRRAARVAPPKPSGLSQGPPAAGRGGPREATKAAVAGPGRRPGRVNRRRPGDVGEAARGGRAASR